MYPNLKLEIFKQGIHQNHLARVLGINEVILSKIIHGYREPSEAQRRLLASYLEADEGWLFEKFDGALPARASSRTETPQERKDGES